jgi:hypothetical protein
MSSIVDKVRDVIDRNWIITGETANRIYFKYEERRGTPKFYFNKKTLEVVRTDKSKESSKSAISVEVMTRIYSIYKENVKPIDAQTVFKERHTDLVRRLLSEYGGAEVGGGTH